MFIYGFDIGQIDSFIEIYIFIRDCTTFVYRSLTDDKNYVEENKPFYYEISTWSNKTVDIWL